jgi:hypothetical protein
VPLHCLRWAGWCWSIIDHLTAGWLQRRLAALAERLHAALSAQSGGCLAVVCAPYQLPAAALFATHQVHYTNPDHLEGRRDSSGLRLVYTPRLRPHDMGVLTLGTVNFTVPPGQKDFPIAPNVAPGACVRASQFQRRAAKLAAGGLVWSSRHVRMLARACIV